MPIIKRIKYNGRISWIEIIQLKTNGDNFTRRRTDCDFVENIQTQW
jgi:hypothetical protein